jgi:hypothetical protein
VLSVVNGEGTTGTGSLIDDIVREGARRMLAAALEAEVNAYIAELADQRDERGRRLPPGTAVHLAGGPVQRQSSPPPLLPTDPPWSFPDRRPRRTAPWTAPRRTRSVRAPWRMTCSAAGVELDPLQGPTQLHNARPLQLYEHTDLERCLTTPDNGRRDALHPDDDGGGV